MGTQGRCRCASAREAQAQVPAHAPALSHPAHAFPYLVLVSSKARIARHFPFLHATSRQGAEAAAADAVHLDVGTPSEGCGVENTCCGLKLTAPDTVRPPAHSAPCVR